MDGYEMGYGMGYVSQKDPGGVIMSIAIQILLKGNSNALRRHSHPARIQGVE